MDIIVSHTAAFWYWRHFSGKLADLKRAKRLSAVTSSAALSDAAEEELLALGFRPTHEHPIDLLYADQRARNRVDRVRAHVSGAAYPAGSFLRLSPHVLIASPELTFAQMAEKLPFERLLLLGFELCGTFALRGPEATWTAQAPLTSASAINAFIKACPKKAIRSAARDAARFVLDNSASPQESRLAILLTLPTAFGGYGLPSPKLNHPVILHDAAYSLYPHTPLRLDLAWPEKRFAVEYLGKEPHDGRQEEDIARVAALAAEGIQSLALTRRQLYDVDAFDAVARSIAGQLGFRLRIRRQDFEMRRARLRQALLTADDTGWSPSRGMIEAD